MHEPQTLGHHVDLPLADRALHRVELSVGVRDADLVEVHERDRTDARASQRLRREAADATDADHHHARRVETPEPALTEEPRRAVEAPMRAVRGLFLVCIGSVRVGGVDLRRGARLAHQRKRHGGKE
jgi:hypothetical protein